MKTVAIVGVGLIGGSFGLALRKAGFNGEIIGVSSPAAIETGLRSGAISRSATLGEAAAADLIYLAQPVDRILQTLEALGPIASAECVITDAGSTKSAIVRKAGQFVASATFIGGHPMAGKEQRGAAAADANLFQGRPYVLTPTAPDSRANCELETWLGRIGADVLRMSAAEHDRAVAFTSHLPQLLSTALAGTLAHQHSEHLSKVFGPGLLDMTRLALSTPELWSSILATNQQDVNTAIDAFMEYLIKLRRTISTQNLAEIFDEAGAFATSLRKTASTN